MPPPPETRASLVVRLRSARDEAAWAEFLAIYEPVILRLMRRHGLQESDSRDVCQQVLAAVASDIEQWQPDGAKESFRRWLFQIARNRVLKFLIKERRRRAMAQGGTEGEIQLAAQPDLQDSLSDEFETEYRQQLLLCAAEQIRGEFRESTWAAFWRTCIDGRSVREVSDELGMSVGNLYVARSRIMARLRVRVSELQAEL